MKGNLRGGKFLVSGGAVFSSATIAKIVAQISSHTSRLAMAIKIVALANFVAVFKLQRGLLGRVASARHRSFVQAPQSPSFRYATRQPPRPGQILYHAGKSFRPSASPMFSVQKQPSFKPAHIKSLEPTAYSSARFGMACGHFMPKRAPLYAAAQLRR